MTSNNYILREIEQKDNEQIATVIRDVLVEMGAPKVGTAYEDKALDDMTATYSQTTSAYYVIEHDGKIIGGAGVAQLDNYDGNICEFQKMYFLSEARGLGLGSKMIAVCLEKAKELGFEKCYLETMPYMDSARALYKKNGFISLDKPVGDTGHYSCNVWMIKEL
jgi:putative acetyltransferase